MQYKKVSIENYRSIKSLTLEDLQAVNLIFGKTNVAKTSILEAIWLLSSPCKPDTILRANHNRGVGIVNTDIFKSCFYKLDISNPVKLKGELKNKEKREFEIHPRKPDGFDFPSIKDTILEGLNFKGTLFKEGDRTTREVTSGITIISGSVEFIAPRSYIHEYHKVFLNTISDLNTVLAQTYSNLNVLFMKKQLEGLIKVLKNIEPSLVNLFLLSDNNVFADIGLDALVPATFLGRSFINTLYIMSTLYLASNGYLIIDAMENNLNPLTMEFTLTAIIKAAKDFNIQVFISTSSSECVRAFNAACAKTLPAGNDEVRLYRIEKDRKEDTLKANMFDRKRMEMGLQADPRK
jgi:AAA15 family ATPase/GTPase